MGSENPDRREQDLRIQIVANRILGYGLSRTGSEDPDRHEQDLRIRIVANRI
jgi:hypothetical protein